jgi:hypothetical protein
MQFLSTPLVASHSSRFLAPTWARELLALLRIACFLRIDSRDIFGRASTVAVLGGLALIAWIAADPLLHSRDLVFNWLAVPDLVFVAAGAFLLAWIFNGLSTPSPGYRRALVLVLGAAPLAILGAVASWKLVQPWLALLQVLLVLYALAYFAYGLRTLTQHYQPLSVWMGMLFGLLFLFSLQQLQANPRLWVRADERLDRLNAAGVDWVRMARAQFAQQSRIDAAIAAFPPQDPGRVEVFFLGFAGYGQESIFARDIQLAADVVGERFAARSRSLLLINDRADLESRPIATEPGLRHALQRVGEVMGAEDVLFLGLSSHGTREQGVRVSNDAMPATILRPTALAQMLEQARIPWRVVVVSACYSGPFVQSLADERSAVITAAAADRKSFGCNDRRQLTYFGEAFYRDAMPAHAGLREAFTAARDALDRKERASGIVPSRPQAHFGARIEEHLARGFAQGR